MLKGGYNGSCFERIGLNEERPEGRRSDDVVR